MAFNLAHIKEYYYFSSYNACQCYFPHSNKVMSAVNLNIYKTNMRSDVKVYGLFHPYFTISPWYDVKIGEGLGNICVVCPITQTQNNVSTGRALEKLDSTLMAILNVIYSFRLMLSRVTSSLSIL